MNEASLNRFVARARRAVGLRGGVNVLVTTSLELRALNQRFRGKDSPTDVLSFPADSISAPKFAGDIAISADIALRNARQLGHSGAEEIKILALHGVLHLAGYDHERDRGEMARLEQRLRRQLRLSAALIERSEVPARPRSLPRKAPPKSASTAHNSPTLDRSLHPAVPRRAPQRRAAR
jgi:probable rRNA maturation factor